RWGRCLEGFDAGWTRVVRLNGPGVLSYPLACGYFLPNPRATPLFHGSVCRPCAREPRLILQPEIDTGVSCMTTYSLKPLANFTPYDGPLLFIIMDGVGLGP